MENNDLDKLFQAKLGDRAVPFDPAGWAAVESSLPAAAGGGASWALANMKVWLSGFLALALLGAGAYWWFGGSSDGSGLMAQTHVEPVLDGQSMVVASTDLLTSTTESQQTVQTQRVLEVDMPRPNPAENTPSTAAPETQDPIATTTTTTKAVATSLPQTQVAPSASTEAQSPLLASKDNISTAAQLQDDHQKFLAIYGGSSTTDDISYMDLLDLGDLARDSMAREDTTRPKLIEFKWRGTAVHVMGGPLMASGLINSGSPARGGWGTGGFLGVRGTGWLNRSVGLNAGLEFSVRNNLNSEKLYRTQPNAQEQRFDSARVTTQAVYYLEIPVYANWQTGRVNWYGGLKYGLALGERTETEFADRTENKLMVKSPGFNSDVATLFGCQFYANPRLAVGVEGHMGWFDITDDNHFGFSERDNNHQIRLTFDYQLYGRKHKRLKLNKENE